MEHKKKKPAAVKQSKEAIIVKKMQKFLSSTTPMRTIEQNRSDVDWFTVPSDMSLVNSSNTKNYPKNTMESKKTLNQWFHFG